MTISRRHSALALGSLSAGLVVFTAETALGVRDDLPDHQTLRSALAQSVDAAGLSADGRPILRMSATVVESDGTVCSIEMSITRDPSVDRWTAGPSAAGGLPNAGRIAAGAMLPAGGYIRRDPPLTAAQLEVLRLRALEQAF